MSDIDPSSASQRSYADMLRDSFTLYTKFITSDEESSLVREVEPHLKRLVYEKDHWDDVIRIYFQFNIYKHAVCNIIFFLPNIALNPHSDLKK